MTAHSANLVVVNRYYDEVWNRGDTSLLDQIVQRDLIGHDVVAGDYGFEQLEGFVAMFRAAFPDFRTRAEHAVAQRDEVALMFRSEGTHMGDFMGIAPSGRKASWRGLVVYRLTEGKIAEIWTEWDSGSLLAELAAPERGSR